MMIRGRTSIVPANSTSPCRTLAEWTQERVIRVSRKSVVSFTTNDRETSLECRVINQKDNTDVRSQLYCYDALTMVYPVLDKVNLHLFGWKLGCESGFSAGTGIARRFDI